MSGKKVSVYFLYDAHEENEKREITKTYNADPTKAVELTEDKANFWIVRGKAVLASERDAEVKADAPPEAKAEDGNKKTPETGGGGNPPKPATGGGNSRK